MMPVNPSLYFFLLIHVALLIVELIFTTGINGLLSPNNLLSPFQSLLGNGTALILLIFAIRYAVSLRVQKTVFGTLSFVNIGCLFTAVMLSPQPFELDIMIFARVLSTVLALIYFFRLT